MRGLTCKGCSGSRPSPYPKASSKSCYNLDVRGATNKNVIVHMPTQTIPPFRMASSYFTTSFSFKHAISLGEHRRLFQVQWSTCFSTLFWIFFLMAGRQQGNLASLETWNQCAKVMAKPPHIETKTMVKWNLLPQKIGGGGKETTSLKLPQISCTFAAELENSLATQSAVCNIFLLSLTKTEIQLYWKFHI